MIKFSINKTKADNLIRALNNIIKETKDYKEPIKKSVDILEDEAKLNFKQQGRLYAKRGSWVPLKPATRKQRIRQGFGGARPILVRTEKLKDSFEKGRITRTSGTLTNTSEIASFHQEGTRKMPAREILGVTDKFKKAAGLVFANFIAKVIRKHL